MPQQGMDVFNVIGSYGPWQRRIFIVFFYSNVLGMWQTLSVTFLAPNVDFTCVQPPPPTHDYLNATYDHRCEVPDSNSSTLVRCTHWEYDTSKFSHTIVSEWDLVCDRQWLVSLAKSVYMFGVFVSVLAFGQLSDWMGRFPTLVAAYAITTSSMLLCLLSSSYTMSAVLRFFQAAGRTGLTIVGVVLMMEVIGPRHRTQTSVALQFGWATGFLTLAGVAWFVRHWFWLQLVISLSLVPLGLAFWFVPESPRWLLMRGKKERLARLLAEAVAVNGREEGVDVKYVDFLKERTEENKDSSSKTLFHLLKMPQMRKRIFIMIFLWMVTAFMYYGLSFNTNDIAGDPYLNFAVAGALEFPAYALVYWGSVGVGRRLTLVWLLLFGGASCIAVLVVPSNIPWLETSFFMFGKFCVTSTFGLLYFYTSELFPTVVRNVSMGLCSMCARIGSTVAPFVRELGLMTHPAVPNVLYAVLALTSGLLALMLPETRGRNMPDSMEEGEAFEQLPSSNIPLKQKSQQVHLMHPLLPQTTTEREKSLSDEFDPPQSADNV